MPSLGTGNGCYSYMDKGQLNHPYIYGLLSSTLNCACT